MTKNWYMLYTKYRPKIEILQEGGFITVGEEYTLTMETDNEIYFVDDCEREVYLYKSEEGKQFKYTKEGNFYSE